MAAILSLLVMLLGLVSFVCWIIVLIDMFKNEVWKGVVGLFCGLYALYYAFAEYQSPNKNMIIGTWLGSIILSIVLQFAVVGSLVAHAPR